MEHPKRKPTRIKNYDYSTPGAYFITFCTHNRRNTLSRIVGAWCSAPVGAIHESPEPQLTGYGRIVDTVIQTLPPHLRVTVDRYVIMPNHVHMILLIPDTDRPRAIPESPLQGRSAISTAVGYIKMNASKAIRQQYGAAAVWQRGYHDHVIRNREDYTRIANYICENPLRWELDTLYSEQ